MQGSRVTAGGSSWARHELRTITERWVFPRECLDPSLDHVVQFGKRSSMNVQFRVLVIDDDPGIREYLQALASRQGYRVFAAADGEEALEKLDETRPDIVTLDAVLPGMDGLETLRRLKQRAPETLFLRRFALPRLQASDV